MESTEEDTQETTTDEGVSEEEVTIHSDVEQHVLELRAQQFDEWTTGEITDIQVQEEPEKRCPQSVNIKITPDNKVQEPFWIETEFSPEAEDYTIGLAIALDYKQVNEEYPANLSDLCGHTIDFKKNADNTDVKIQLQSSLPNDTVDKFITPLSSWRTKALGAIGLASGAIATYSVSALYTPELPYQLNTTFQTIGEIIAAGVAFVVPLLLFISLLMLVMRIADSPMDTFETSFEELPTETEESSLPLPTIIGAAEQSIQGTQVLDATIDRVIKGDDSDSFKIEVVTNNGIPIVFPIEVPSDWDKNNPTVKFLEDLTNGSVAYLKGETVSVVGNKGEPSRLDVDFVVTSDNTADVVATDSETDQWVLTSPTDRSQLEKDVYDKLPRQRAHGAIVGVMAFLLSLSIIIVISNPFLILSSVASILLILIAILD